MSIIKHFFRGRFAAPARALAPFEVTCRLVNSCNGLESMHVTGWVAVDGIQTSISRIGIVSHGLSMLGLERSIVMEQIDECVQAQLAA